MYLSMSVALTTDVEVALGSFVLNHIFKDMNDLIFFFKWQTQWDSSRTNLDAANLAYSIQLKCF